MIKININDELYFFVFFSFLSVLWFAFASSTSSASFVSSVLSVSFSYILSVEAFMTVRFLCFMTYFFFVFSITQIESIVFQIVLVFSIEIRKWLKIKTFCFMKFLTFLTRSSFFDNYLLNIYLLFLSMSYDHEISVFLFFRFFLSFFSTIAYFAVFLMSSKLSIADFTRWRKIIFCSRSLVFRLNRTLCLNSWKCDFAIIFFAFSTNSAN